LRKKARERHEGYLHWTEAKRREDPTVHGPKKESAEAGGTRVFQTALRGKGKYGRGREKALTHTASEEMTKSSEGKRAHGLGQPCLKLEKGGRKK